MHLRLNNVKLNAIVIRTLTKRPSVGRWVSSRFKQLMCLMMWMTSTRPTTFTDILNEHAPVKENYVKTKVCPFINTKLRKASYKKAMLFNKYKKCRSTTNWEAYRKQRNLTTNIKRNSVRTYFDERCAGRPKSKDFWPTVKPFITNKGHFKDPSIILSEDNIIISDQTSVSNVLNDFYVNVAKHIQCL